MRLSSETRLSPETTAWIGQGFSGCAESKPSRNQVFRKSQALFTLKEEKKSPGYSVYVQSVSYVSLNICVARVFINKCLMLADITLKHQTVHGHCTAINTSTEVNGALFPPQTLLCCCEFSMVTFLARFRWAKHHPVQDALDFDNLTSSKWVEF